MKSIYIYCFFFLISSYAFVSYQEEFDLHKMVSTLKIKQFEELKKISVKNNKGFKYISEHLGKKRFTSFAITKVTKHEISEEDKRKIREIINKYK